MRALPVMVVLALLATQLGGCAAKGRGTRARMVEAAAPRGNGNGSSAGDARPGHGSGA